MTGPKEGDRVRCTMGESVVVGTATWVGPTGIDIELASGGKATVWDPTEWTVEVLPEPEPPVGTVVIDSGGDVWRRRPTKTGPAWVMACADRTIKPEATLADIERHWDVTLTLLEPAHA